MRRSKSTLLEESPLLSSTKAPVSLLSLVFGIFLISAIVFIPFCTNHSSPSPNQSIQSAPQIRGGKDASGLHYPWMASWRLEGLHCCSGVLINKDPPIVLTAAHCVTCHRTTIDLKRTLTDPPDSEAESHSILFWIQHPFFGSPAVSSNDVALVVLNGSTNIDPLPMVPPKLPLRDVYSPGTAMEIFGYGHIDVEDTIISDQLQRGEISMWSKLECFAYLNTFCGYGSRWDNTAMLCGFNEHVSTERGDSGGPAVMNGYLTGINSWSPPSQRCAEIGGPNYKLLDVFVDVGSARHWIEDTKPTVNSYFIVIHICSDSNVQIDGEISAVLYGANGLESGPWTLTDPASLRTLFVPGNEYIFQINNIENIGWTVDRIKIIAESSVNLCIDMIVTGRFDGAELIMGSAERITLNDNCTVNSSTSCQFDFELDLLSDCGLSSTQQEIPSNQLSGSHDPDQHQYVIIIHVCAPEISSVGGSTDTVWVRLHGVIGTSEWIELQNEDLKDQWQMNRIYVFGIETEYNLGVNIDAVDLQIEDSDGVCVDMVAAGKTVYPTLWKGSHETFFLDNPCAVDPIHESKYSHLAEEERQRLIKDKKNQRAVRQRLQLTQNFDNLAVLLQYNLEHPIPERPELLQMAIQRIEELRQHLSQEMEIDDDDL